MVRHVRLCCFFFASRRRHTRFDCDWSSDVCSSDLYAVVLRSPVFGGKVASVDDSKAKQVKGVKQIVKLEPVGTNMPWAGVGVIADSRSEERRVGKECRSRWSPYH